MHWKIKQKQGLINSERGNCTMKLLALTSSFLIFIGNFSVCDGISFSSAWAQSASGKSSASGDEKKKSLSFEDELVEGATAKPELFYLFQKKNFNFKRLIKLRENFVPEMRRTSEDVQRGRNSN